jgi:CheB methylesterase/Response regulator receiver domain
VTVADGGLSPRVRTEHHRPIDHFLRSLAQDQEGRTIGVVLSGTGTDGRLGLRPASSTFGRHRKSDRLPVLNGVRPSSWRTRDPLQAILVRCGAEVTIATVDAALEALDQAPFDVLISDIAMPDQDGYSFIRQVPAREVDRGGRIPAMALTAYARNEDRDDARHTRRPPGT